jgi:hypothetical protein
MATLTSPVAQAAESIVRFRIRADFGQQTQAIISPRNNDPYQWHGYHIAPTIDTAVTHSFITKPIQVKKSTTF